MLTLGERLRRYRERHGWSQNQLHYLSEVPQSTISDIEAGKATAVTYETMAKLAKALHVSVSDLGEGEQYEELVPVQGGETPITAPLDGSTDHVV